MVTPGRGPGQWRKENLKITRQAGCKTWERTLGEGTLSHFLTNACGKPRLSGWSGWIPWRPEQRLIASPLMNLNCVRYRAWATFGQGVAEVQVRTCHTHSLISENLTSPPGGRCPGMSCTQQDSETWEAAMENLGPLDLASSQLFQSLKFYTEHWWVFET